MQGYEVKFNVYATSQDEAEAATKAIKSFINDMAGKGIAVTATKLTDAISKWKNNVFVTNYFR